MTDTNSIKQRINQLETELNQLKRQLSEQNQSNNINASNEPFTYASSGVSIDNGDALVQNIKPLAKSTGNRPGVPNKNDIIGGFGGLFDLKQLNYNDPVLVSGTDGVGTKLFIAQLGNKHDSIGIDLVAMSVNDILTNGAEPLFFLDYYACSKLDVNVATDVIKGISQACIDSNCALIGGETAEMPGLYNHDDYDLAGFAVGVVERNNILPKVNKITQGCKIIGLPSSGIHSNGYSLVRKVINTKNIDVHSPHSEFNNQRLVDVLLTPTRLYVKSVLSILHHNDYNQHIYGLAHITGGGLIENIPRILPNNVKAVLDCNSWKSHIPHIFRYLFKQNITTHEMSRTFNCGIGMTIVVDSSKADSILQQLHSAGETNAVIIGEIQNKSDNEQHNVVLNNINQLFI